jgi:uncharacterized protein YkwD
VPSARKILLAIALVSAWALVFGSPASAAPCQNTGLPATELTSAEIEDSVGCLLNEERARRGLGPLQPNESLRAAAFSHSTEMVSQGYFEHTSPAGLTFYDRIEGGGYMRGARSWVVGENLIWGTGDFSTPQFMVTSWMQSPPHRENVLRARFDEIGIAAVPGTPEPVSNPTGVTVSSEFGDRVFGKRSHSARSARRAGARR